MRAVLALLLASTAHAAPVRCSVADDVSPTASVVRIDCEVVGIRAAYTMDAHRDSTRQMKQLDAAAFMLTEQRDECVAARVTERALAVESLNLCADALESCRVAVTQAAPEGNRVLWFISGAVLSAVATVAIYEVK